MFKIDLHTHSTASPDGGITVDEYIKLIGEEKLDYIAVTDHDSTKNARSLHRTLGDKIIIGQEVTCREGEIIGLFITETIKPNRPAEVVAKEIKKQGGLVYIPHPFETIRKGLPKSLLDSMVDLVDIVEVYNGRALVQNKGPEASVWARVNHKVTAASSDAHGLKGVGTAYSVINKPPTTHNLIQQLNLGHRNMQRPPLKTLLYPKANRIKQKLFKNRGKS